MYALKIQDARWKETEKASGPHIQAAKMSTRKLCAERLSGLSEE